MTSSAPPATARHMWHLLETIHAVVYFAPEITAEYKRLGLKGFWMGYFAGRSAPLGPVPAEVVTAAFFNFHPDMVARALPDAWQHTTPTEALEARLAGVDHALRRLLTEDTLSASGIADAADLTEKAIAGCTIAGRPMFAAHTTIPRPEPPHLRLWHAATLVREHRGDAHIAANLAEGFDGLDAHIILCASGTTARGSIQPHRGWTDDHWAHAAHALTDAGILDDDGNLTDAGRAARARVEDTTDRLATEPWQHLGAADTARLRDLLQPIAQAVIASGALPFPNPMGLPEPDDAGGP